MKNPFTVAKALSKALSDNGIDPEATDLTAAIAAKIAPATDPTLAAKAEKWDKFAASAKASGLDADAIVATDSGLDEQLDTHARKLLDEHLSTNAPTKIEHVETLQPTPTGMLDLKTVATQYTKLADAGDLVGCQALVDQHGASFLTHLNLAGV